MPMVWAHTHPASRFLRWLSGVVGGLGLGRDVGQTVLRSNKKWPQKLALSGVVATPRHGTDKQTDSHQHFLDRYVGGLSRMVAGQGCNFAMLYSCLYMDIPEYN